MFNNKTRIDLPLNYQRQIIDHCLRKLEGNYLENENRNLKAFGLLAGDKNGERIKIAAVYPLMKNVRSVEPHSQFMDRMMEEHAIPSETPLKKRGWVADPEELAMALAKFKSDGHTLVGSYHMHRVSWEHDRTRDTPTALDKILGRDSRLIMFIVSMVNPEKPIIRAYSEGSPEREIPIVLTDG